jgi:hypothetical protein
MLSPSLNLLTRRAAGEDTRAYTTSASLWSLENLLSASVDSDLPEGLAHRGWYFYVGLLAALPTLWSLAQMTPDSN